MINSYDDREDNEENQTNTKHDFIEQEDPETQRLSKIPPKVMYDKTNSTNVPIRASATKSEKRPKVGFKNNNRPHENNENNAYDDGYDMRSP